MGRWWRKSRRSAEGRFAWNGRYGPVRSELVSAILSADPRPADSLAFFMDRQAHWESIHREKACDAVSWYRPHLDVSLALIEQAAADRGASILDVGAGQSTLVDDLLVRGYTNLTILDVAPAAVEGVRERLGDQGAAVRWLVGDVTSVAMEPLAYDIWHDRAVFHFLTSAAERAAYVRQLSKALRRAGKVIVAAFAEDAPQQCSGLDVVRYDASGLEREFGPGFQLIRTTEERHATPAGVVQPFVYCCFSKES